MDERSYTLSIGNGDYFWTNKDTLWNYVQTLSGKKSAITFKKHYRNNTYFLQKTWKVERDSKEN